jgi:hypothetical protein
VDVVLSDPPRRYRLMLSTIIFGESVGVGRARPALLNERLAELVRSAPNTLPVGRGVRAAIDGRPLPKFSSLRDVDRELGWLLWRAHAARH